MQGIDVSEDLRHHAANLAGIFRCQIHDLLHVRGQREGGLTYASAGIGSDEAAGWTSAGLDPLSAGYWRANGFDARAARDWRGAGFEAPTFAGSWRRHGFDAAEAASWARAGVEVRAAVEMRSAGVSPEQASARRTRDAQGVQGAAPAVAPPAAPAPRAVESAPAPRAPSEAPKADPWQGFADAAAWKAAGFGDPAEAADWRRRGFRDPAKARAALQSDPKSQEALVSRLVLMARGGDPGAVGRALAARRGCVNGTLPAAFRAVASQMRPVAQHNRKAWTQTITRLANEIRGVDPEIGRACLKIALELSR